MHCKVEHLRDVYIIYDLTASIDFTRHFRSAEDPPPHVPDLLRTSRP